MSTLDYKREIEEINNILEEAETLIAKVKELRGIY